MKFNMTVAGAICGVGGIGLSLFFMTWPPIATVLIAILIATLAVIAGVITKGA